MDPKIEIAQKSDHYLTVYADGRAFDFRWDDEKRHAERFGPTHDSSPLILDVVQKRAEEEFAKIFAAA